MAEMFSSFNSATTISWPVLFSVQGEGWCGIGVKSLGGCLFAPNTWRIINIFNLGPSYYFSHHRTEEQSKVAHILALKRSIWQVHLCYVPLWRLGWVGGVEHKRTGGQSTPLLTSCLNHIIICGWRQPPSLHNQYPSLGTCYWTTIDLLQCCPHTHTRTRPHTPARTFYQSIVYVNYEKANDEQKAWQTNLHDTLIFKTDKMRQ